MPGRRNKTKLMEQAKIYGLLGRRGSGKSLVGCHFCAQAAKKGRRIYFSPPGLLTLGENGRAGFPPETTIPLDLEALVMLDEELTDALIFLDEIQVLLNSRRSMTFGNYMLSNFLTQIRKRRATLLYTSQFAHSLDFNLREQTDVHMQCRALVDGEVIEVMARDTWGTISKTPFVLNQRMDTRAKALFTLRHGRSLWHLYDTNAVQSVATTLGITKDAVVSKYHGGQQDSIDAAIRSVIYEQVRAGAAMIQPANFASLLARRYGINVSADVLAKALGRIGLPKSEMKNGVWYFLPDLAELQDWMDGIGRAS